MLNKNRLQKLIYGLQDSCLKKKLSRYESKEKKLNLCQDRKDRTQV